MSNQTNAAYAEYRAADLRRWPAKMNENTKNEIKRYAILAVASTLGLLAAVGYSILIWPDLSRAGVNQDDNPFLFLEVCALFFSVLYNSGILMSDWIQHPTLAKEIASESRWRMTLINITLGLGILCMRITEFKGWTFQSILMIIYALVLICTPIWSWANKTMHATAKSGA